MNLCDIKQEIDKFEKVCREMQDTDTREAWILLKWIRGMADGLRQATPEEIQDARDQHGTSDIEIDKDAVVSGETWVQAWVYLYPIKEDD